MTPSDVLSIGLSIFVALLFGWHFFKREPRGKPASKPVKVPYKLPFGIDLLWELILV